MRTLRGVAERRGCAGPAAGGQISVLTQGDYGLLAIAKSVSITNDGAGEATILAGGVTPALTINAGAGDIVSLRGLVIDGLGTGSIGISITRASAVHVQN